jgi:energy-coupling factor transporter ATP-binding protein EcfA2
MRLIELEINNIRGIRHQVLMMGGDNFAICGPNGSGKSTVVDAVDFLLTGRISRLTGQGTGGLSLDKHGCHIDTIPEDAWVRGLLWLHGHDQPVELRRCLAHPGRVEYLQGSEDQMALVFALANHRQHVLTRREILKFVAAEPADRASAIQELLDLGEVETMRGAMVKARNQAKGGLRETEKVASDARAAVATSVGLRRYDEQSALEAVNALRAQLGADPAAGFTIENVKAGVVPPAPAPEIADATPAAANAVKSLQQQLLPAFADGTGIEEANLRSALREVASDPQLAQLAAQQDFTWRGLRALGDSTACPLCDTPWPEGRLRLHLEAKLQRAGAAAQLVARIDAGAKALRRALEVVPSAVAQIDGLAPELPAELGLLRAWAQAISVLLSRLDDPLAHCQDLGQEAPSVAQWNLDPDVARAVESASVVISARTVTLSPEQTAWDTLTRVEENLKRLRAASEQNAMAQLVLARAAGLEYSFIKARDEVLEHLYANVKDDFVSMYKAIHGADEDTFDARLEPKEAALNFTVNFQTKGFMPPHAVHSEGHQDSMGLCLFLALSKRLTGDVLDLVVLDDVMMSVDADHRRATADLLARGLPEKQFLITTHDHTWMNQLRTCGLIPSARQVVEFYNWDFHGGPRVNTETDFWQHVDSAMAANDVPGAAAAMRHGLEQFFESACDSLAAKVVYKSTGRYSLGDFLPAAISRLKEHLKGAKQVANAHNQKDLLQSIAVAESAFSSDVLRSQAEQWAINSTVHYDNWHQLSVADFVPVAEAFKDLCHGFVCSHCGGMFRAAFDGPNVATVGCSCGQVNWNLRKPK